MVDRPTHNEYYMSLAMAAAKRSTCSRLMVGAIVLDRRLRFATGYNGAPSGKEHCQDHEDDTPAWKLQPCLNVVHAEINAILKMGNDGIAMYITHTPCFECAKVIINAGIQHIYYNDVYIDRKVDVHEYLTEAEIEVTQVILE